jgi:hypothetical protein
MVKKEVVMIATNQPTNLMTSTKPVVAPTIDESSSMVLVPKANVMVVSAIVDVLQQVSESGILGESSVPPIRGGVSSTL